MVPLIACTVLSGLLGLLLLGAPAFAAIRTVDCDGGVAYTTIQAAVNAAGPGDTIRIRECSAGAYDEQVVIENKAGTAANPIILEPDTGAAPILRWTSTAEDGNIQIRNSNYITIRNFAFPGGFVYTGVTTSTVAIRIQSVGQDVIGVKITGNRFKDHRMTQPSQGPAVIFANADTAQRFTVRDLVVSNNTFDGVRRVALRLHSTVGAIIEQNTITGITCGFQSTAAVKTEVIKLSSGATQSLALSSKNVIRGNYIDGAGQTGAQCQAELGTTLIPAWIGIYCDVNSADNVFERNFVKNFAQDVPRRVRAIFAESRCHRTIIRHNVVRNASTCIEISAPSAGTVEQTLENNTCYDTEQGLFYEEDNTILSAKNNVFFTKTSGTPRLVVLDDGSDANSTFDGPTTGLNFNAYSSTLAQPFNRAGTLQSFSAWKSSCNCDASSTFGNTSAATLWVDAANDDFTPASGSPLINAGTGTYNEIGAVQQVTINTCATVDADTWECAVHAVFTPVIADCTKITPRRTAPAAATGTASACQIRNNTTVRFDVAGFTPTAGNTLVVDFAYGAVRDALLAGNTIRGNNLAVAGVAVTNKISTTAPTLSSCIVGDTTRNKMRGTFNTAGSPPMVLGACPTGWTARDDAVANNPTSCLVVGSDQIEFTVGTNFTAGVIDLSYSAVTGSTTNTAGTEVTTITNLACTNNIGTAPPTLISAQVFNDARHAFVFTVDIGNSTTLTPATGMTGITCRKDTDGTPTALTITQCDRTTATQFKCLASEEMTSGDGLDCSYSQGTGNITDDALVELVAFTNRAVTNGVVADAATVTLAHSRAEWPHLAEASARVFCVEDTACLRVAPTGVILVRQQLRCSGGACASQAYVPYASLNGGTATTIGNDFGTHKLRLATDQVKSNLAATTRQLSACAGSFVAGSVYLNPLAVFPPVALADTECTEFAFAIELQDTLVSGDSVVIGLQKDGGGGVVQTQPLTITVYAGGGFR